MAKLEAQTRNLKADLRATTQETISWSAVIPQLQAELAAELSQANEAAVTTRSQLEDQVSELQFSLQVTFLHSYHPPYLKPFTSSLHLIPSPPPPAPPSLTPTLHQDFFTQ